MNKEEQLLLAALKNKLKLCEKRGMQTYSGFLSSAEVNIAESFCIAQKACFRLDGGYEDAERRVCIFLPGPDPDSFSVRGYGSGGMILPENDPSMVSIPENDPLAVLRINVLKHGRELTHRDYLGSILGIGVQRSVVGDIIVRENGADAVILKDMAEFFELNLTSVGRSEVTVSVCGRGILAAAEQKTETIYDTVASLRLDSICAGAFRLARGKAQEAIKQGLVSVNGRQCLKPDAEISENDRISFRGKGKAILSGTGSRTRKDRIPVIIERLK